MSGTKTGGQKAIETQIAKYGSEEAFRAEMRRRRALVKKPTGFAAMDAQKLKEISRKGGLSKKNENLPQEPGS